MIHAREMIEEPHRWLPTVVPGRAHPEQQSVGSMAVCGGRQKARAHYRRTRAER